MRTQSTSVEINGVAHATRVRATETVRQARDRIRRNRPVAVKDDKPKPDPNRSVKGRWEPETQNFTRPVELERRPAVSTLGKHMRAHQVKHHRVNPIGGHRSTPEALPGHGRTFGDGGARQKNLPIYFKMNTPNERIQDKLRPKRIQSYPQESFQTRQY